MGESKDALRHKHTRKLRGLIEAGGEAHLVYVAVTTLAAEIEGIDAATIYLPQAQNTEALPFHSSVVAHFGGVEIPEPKQSSTEKNARRAVLGDSGRFSTGKQSAFHYTDIVCLGAPIGCLGVHIDNPPNEDTKEHLADLAYYVSVVFERQRLGLALENYADRLEVLNELNQLIASNVALRRITRTIARESAFRFGADCALSLLISHSGDSLDVRGSYGCAPDAIPPQLPLDNNLFGRVLSLGGIISMPDLAKQSEHGMEFLKKLGLNSVHCSSLEVKGETVGAILTAYREPSHLGHHERAMFEDFARGAAVAITNARTQDRLTSYAENLEDLIQQRTADLAVQTARAEEANKAKSRFVTNISHELRTPLTAIVGYSSVINDGVFGEVNEKQKSALKSIMRSSEHLRDLIDDVLNLSRIESGKEEAQTSEIELFPLVDQVHKLMLQTAMGKEITLKPLIISEDIKTQEISFDPRHIRQVLINLLSNAIKYTKPGGTVEIISEVVGDKAKIGIRDTGVGIAPEQIKKLFERFERGSNSYSNEQVGTGVGLALTKQLVEINGGNIIAESTLGEGSTFWVLAPLAEKHERTPISEDTEVDEENEEYVSLKGLNVLIVDDSQLTCNLLKEIIKNAGAIAHVSNNVDEAIKLAENTPLDAALIDLAMPGKNGIDLIDHFRKNCDGPLKTMPLIVVSACVFDQDKDNARRHGASAFIPKPFRPREIIYSIRDLTTANALNIKPSYV